MLTIGIPTFNRRETVSERIAALVAAGAPERAEVVVIDDASTDGTDAALRELCAATPVRLLRNESNRGYAGTMLRLFAECRTPYLLIGSDDDRVVVDSLASLERFLEERAPAFVSTRFYAGERLYRGTRAAGAIGPEELLAASAHAPGLVYDVAACREIALDSVEERLGRGCAAARVYPQVMILARLLLAGRRCLWWDGACVEGGDWAPTGITDGEGAPYHHLAPRWAQMRDLLDFLAEEAPAAAEPGVATAMASTVEEGLFWKLRSGIEHERPELLAAFDRSAARFYAGRWRWEGLRRRAKHLAGRLAASEPHQR